MAQLLVFFATSRCSPHVIKWFKQTSQSARVHVRYVPENSLWNMLKKQKGFQLSLVFCPQLPQNKTKKAQKKIICTFISQERKSWKLKNMNKKPQTEKWEGETVKTQHWAGFNHFWLSGCLVWYLQQRSGGEHLARPAVTTKKSNILLYSPKTALRNEPKFTIHMPKIQSPCRWLPMTSHLQCRVLYKLKVWMFWKVPQMFFTVLHFDIVHGSHTSDRLEVQWVWRRKTKLGRVHQASLFLAGKRSCSS